MWCNKKKIVKKLWRVSNNELYIIKPCKSKNSTRISIMHNFQYIESKRWLFNNYILALYKWNILHFINIIRIKKVNCFFYIKKIIVDLRFYWRSLSVNIEKLYYNKEIFSKKKVGNSFLTCLVVEVYWFFSAAFWKTRKCVIVDIHECGKKMSFHFQ
jgi:hypothetical protein